MCHLCESEDTAYICDDCKEKILAEAVREQAIDNVRRAASSAPTNLEELAAC